jgi:hypothetical protein
MYMVVALIYAPPGTSNTTGASSMTNVQYTDQTSFGTTVSASNSFKDAVTVKAKAGDMVTSAELDFSASQTTGKQTSVQMQYTSSDKIQVNGPPQDGIDHDYDVFYIWLNPTVSVNATPRNNFEWELGVNGQQNVIDVQVGELKPPQNPPTFTRGNSIPVLLNWGLTQSDFNTILTLDPFASGDTAIDPSRYVLLKQDGTVVYNYLPGESTQQTITLTTAETNTSTSTKTNEYGVTATITAGIKDVVSGSVSVSWDWTNSASQTTSTNETQTAAFTLYPPSSMWKGAHDIEIYWDGIWATFMFAYGA